jgi:hypothetical protein
MKGVNLILFSIFILIGTGCQTQKSYQEKTTASLVNTVTTGCETELKSYCSQVTTGEGRVLACLYSHSEKLSGKCEFALYDASAQLERFIATISYVASECENDLEKYCSSVPAGEGRLVNCLTGQQVDKISQRCDQALQDANMK